MKVCSRCKIEKDESEFNKNKGTKDGLRSNCKECKKIKDAEYRKLHIAEAKILSRNWYDKNSDKVKATAKEWNKNHPEKMKKSRVNWYDNNPGYNTKYFKERKLIDPLFKLICDMRSLIGTSMKNGGYSKASRTAEYLGCTYEEFKIHIESLFQEGMTWQNHGEWEYDHIYPISRAIDEDHFKQLSHYTNFQPLWKVDNRNKRDNII
jgi:hypothetical protein